MSEPISNITESGRSILRKQNASTNKFPFLFFKLLFYDFQQLSENATARMKFKHYAKRILHWFCLVSLVAEIFQDSANAYSHSNDFKIVMSVFTVCWTINPLTKIGILKMIKNWLITKNYFYKPCCKIFFP